MRTIHPGARAVAAEIESDAKVKLKISDTEKCVWELAGTGESVSMGDIVPLYTQRCVPGGPAFPWALAGDSSLALELNVYLPTAQEVPSSGMSGCTLRKGASKGHSASWQQTAKAFAKEYCPGSPGTGRKYLKQDNKDCLMARRRCTGARR